MSSKGIDISNVAVNSKIQLIDTMGRQLQSFTSTTTDFTIDIRQKGIYFLKIQKNPGFNSFKIIY